MLTFALFMSHLTEHFGPDYKLTVVKPCPSDRLYFS